MRVVLNLCRSARKPPWRYRRILCPLRYGRATLVALRDDRPLSVPHRSSIASTFTNAFSQFRADATASAIADVDADASTNCHVSAQCRTNFRSFTNAFSQFRADDTASANADVDADASANSHVSAQRCSYRCRARA